MRLASLLDSQVGSPDLLIIDQLGACPLHCHPFRLQDEHPAFSHGEVLQQAMLQILSDAKTDTDAHPRFWAPFVVAGEPKKGLN